MASLTAENLRVTQYGQVVVHDVDFVLSGARTAILGAPNALFDVATGLQPPAAGRIHSDHVLVQAGAIDTVPPAWTVLEWLEWRIRLAGVPTAAARRQGTELLGAFGLHGHGPTLLKKATPLVRRALPLVAALGVREPDALVLLADPFDGLNEAEAHGLAETFAQHATRFVAFLPSLSLRSPLAAGLDQVLVLDQGRVVAQGTPDELLASARTYVLRVAGGTWTERLEALGIEVLGSRPLGTGTELTVAFEGERGPGDVFDLAVQSGDVVLELFPAGGKLMA